MTRVCFSTLITSLALFAGAGCDRAKVAKAPVPAPPLAQAQVQTIRGVDDPANNGVTDAAPPTRVKSKVPEPGFAPRLEPSKGQKDAQDLAPPAEIQMPPSGLVPRADLERDELIVLTSAAATQVRKLMKEGNQRFLRVYLKDLNYKLDLDDNLNPQADLATESRGVAIAVDKKSLPLIPAGLTVDYGESNGQVGFKITGPNLDRVPPDASKTLAEARRGFKTKLARQESDGVPAPTPPANLFSLIKFDAPLGKNPAYLGIDPKDGKKHPAIIWITGGDCNTIDEIWKEVSPHNDQTAAAYRKAGIVMMFPSLRGGNDSPGVKEGFLGEVDDVLAAFDFLKKQSYVDPARIYLGGHSTGGTLALLTSECSARFRAVFSFGPVNDVLGYSPKYNPFVYSERKEIHLRAPVLWLHSIKSPTFIIEGADGNKSSLDSLRRSSKNPQVKIFEVKGANHFAVLAPINRLIAEKILRDTGPACDLVFTEEELAKLFVK